MAARAHVMPKSVAATPLYGGPKSILAEASKLEPCSAKPLWPMAAAFHSGKLMSAASPDAVR